MSTRTELRAASLADLGDGVHAFVKHDCATCTLVAPVLVELLGRTLVHGVHSQDDPEFPEEIAAIGRVHDETSLRHSFALEVETVPTLIRVKDGVELQRIVGWNVDEWTAFTGLDLVAGFPTLPKWRPGCGSKNLDIGMPEALAIRFGVTSVRSRRVELASAEDEHEAMYARGWSDGLPLIPPTEERVLRMLAGTSRHRSSRPDRLHR